MKLKKFLAMLLSCAFILQIGAICGFAADESIIKVACVGDSITAGSQSTNAATRSYPTQLKNMLGDGYEVKNFGYSGKAVLFDKDRSYNVTQQYTDSIAYGADIVIFMLGTNDINYMNAGHFDDGEGNYSQTAFDAQFKADMTTLLSAYMAVSDTVYVANTPSAFRNATENTNLSHVAELQAEVASELGIELIDVRTQTSGFSAYYADGLHPNDTGYVRLAQIFYRDIFDGETYNVTIKTEPNASVSFGAQTITSDANGEVTFVSAAGTFDVKVNITGYLTDGATQITVTGDETFEIDLGEKLENLAYNKPSSTKFVGADGINGNSNAFDGSLATRWGTPTRLAQLPTGVQALYADNDAYLADRPHQWLQVELGADTVFDQVLIHWDDSYAKGYKLQTSNDGINFKDILTVTDGTGGITTHNFDKDVTAKYLRFQGVTERGNGYGYSIYEIEVYHVSVDTNEPAPYGNVAPDGTPFCLFPELCWYKNESRPRPVTTINDGTTNQNADNYMWGYDASSTNEMPGGGDPDDERKGVYAGIMFDALYDVDCVKLYWTKNEYGNMTKTELEYTLDGTNWFVLSDTPDSSDTSTLSGFIIDTYTFDKTTVKGMRAYLTGRKNSYFKNMTEFEIFGTGTDTIIRNFTTNIAPEGTASCLYPEYAHYKRGADSADSPQQRPVSNINNGTTDDTGFSYCKLDGCDCTACKAAGANFSGKYPETDAFGNDAMTGTITFNGIYKFNKVVVSCAKGEYNNASKRVEYTLDGVNWIDFASAMISSEEVSSLRVDTFKLDAPVKATAVRVVVYSSKSVYPINIREVEIYGQKDFSVAGAQVLPVDDDNTEYKLRFVTTINMDYFTLNGDRALSTDIAEIGTLIVREDAGITDLTVNNTSTSIKKLATNYLCSSGEFEGCYTFTAAITSIIGEELMARRYTARPYIIFNDGSVYYGGIVTRCVNDAPNV